mmetsp:Transcript_14213/g.41372  ORF Transcript_14213/g.41372 Transcript_14213/m.41372 type:complete len:205 (-) Transcript_14213:194-808(-)
MRVVAMQLLLAAVHIVRQPDRRDRTAAKLPLPVLNERVLQLVVQSLREVHLRLCANQRVLVRNMPVVPHEARRRVAAGLAKALVKHIAQLSRARQKLFFGDDVPCKAQLLQGFALLLPLLCQRVGVELGGLVLHRNAAYRRGAAAACMLETGMSVPGRRSSAGARHLWRLHGFQGATRGATARLARQHGRRGTSGGGRERAARL